MKRILLFLSLILMLSFTTQAAVRETDVTAPAEGNVFVYVPGEFEKADIASILQLVNGYRLEACKSGYPNPEDSSQKLTMEDYSEVKWSGDLEWIAQTRAAEGSVKQDHTRPNGTSCFTISHEGIYSSSETLAWNYGSLLGGIRQWYGEKNDWVNQNENAVTGHYTAMISPSLKNIGIGCFTSQSGDWSCVAGAYSYESGLSESSQGIYGECIQKMEVPASCVSSLTIDGASSVAAGMTASYSPEQFVSFAGIMGGELKTPILPSAEAAQWSVSDMGIASIDANGHLTATMIGSVDITLSYADGISATKSIVVTKPEKGTILKSDSVEYKVTSVSGEVSLTKGSKAGDTVTIPAAVSFYGIQYKVTSIDAGAFKNSKMKSLTIGSNVVSIGKNAFYGCGKLKAVTIPVKVASIGSKAFYNCKKLKTLTIKTKKLTKKKVGNKAFSKTAIKKVKVPKAKKKSYKTWLYQKGIPKTAVIK